MAAGPEERTSPSIDELTIDTIRTLTLDAVEKAASGHPGTPMGMAPVGYTLWSRFLRYDPDRPDWPNRDRFVLSVGHASLLLYSLLHLSGVREIDADGRHTGKPAVSLDDIKQFRQLDSKTPGHPEYRVTTGVEATTGPLGQGCGNSVGMAIAGTLARRAFQPRRRHLVRPRRLRLVQRRRHDGRRGERGRVARRASQACRTFAGSTTTTTSRSRAAPPLAFSERRGRAVSRLWLERPACRRRERSGCCRASARDVPAEPTTRRP